MNILATMNEYAGLAALLLGALFTYIFLRMTNAIQSAKSEITEKIDAKLAKIQETYIPYPRSADEYPATRRDLNAHEAASQRELASQARINASFESAMARVETGLSRIDTLMTRVDSTMTAWHTRLGKCEEEISVLEHVKADRLQR